MIDHEFSDSTNHLINSFSNCCLFVVDVDEGEGLVDNSLIKGVLYLAELVGVYNGCLEVMFEVTDAVLVINIMVNGIRVDDIVLRGKGLKHVGNRWLEV